MKDSVSASGGRYCSLPLVSLFDSAAVFNVMHAAFSQDIDPCINTVDQSNQLCLRQN